jgi:hypothetical protein
MYAKKDSWSILHLKKIFSSAFRFETTVLGIDGVERAVGSNLSVLDGERLLGLSVL